MTAIEDAMGTRRVVVRSRGDAQPDAYLRASPERFSLIHFVAHAVVNREEPLQSAIILSGQSSDYRLLARDVVSTPIRADLVTISSCRSAAARSYAGEGLVGLSWAFLGAGARNVIASLWDVNDRSTPSLMASLYAGIARGDNPAEALRAAKLEMIHSGNVWRKPWYWGPFALYTRSPESRPDGLIRRHPELRAAMLSAHR